jgi:Tfp pilus assembly protein PilE
MITRQPGHRMVAARRGARGRKAAPAFHPRARRAGLTLIEAALALCVAGILLAVGIPAFVRALQTSKLSEPPTELARIYAATAAYYAMAAPKEEPSRHHCLPERAGPTPAEPSKSAVSVKFSEPTAPGAATWTALGYEPSKPIRYRYSLETKRSGCGLTRNSPAPFAVSVRAEGDLDGDGALSLFERNASIEHGTLRPDPLLIMRDAVE